VRAGYLAIAAAEPDRVVRLDASHGMAEIEELIRRRVEGLLRSPVRPSGPGILASG
jgi:thymidylate kinase